MYQKHKCGRQFLNKSGKANWVAKVIVDRLKNNNKMKLNDLIAYVRMRYTTEIPCYKAFKGRHLSKQIVEGDSS